MHVDFRLLTVERFNGWAISVGHGALPHTASAHTYLERVRLYGRNPGSSFCTILTGSHTTTITLLPNITCTAHEEGGGGREVKGYLWYWCKGCRHVHLSQKGMCIKTVMSETYCSAENCTMYIELTVSVNSLRAGTLTLDMRNLLTCLLKGKEIICSGTA